MALVGIGVAIAGLVTLPLLPGNYVTTRIAMGTIGVAMVGMLYLLHRTRTPATFHQGFARVLAWYIPAFAVCGAIPFFGPFSGATMLLVLGLFFTSLGANFGLALATYLTCVSVQGYVAGSSSPA